MNIKKVFVVSCIVLQFSNFIHASVNQAAFNLAFQAFDAVLTGATNHSPAQAAAVLYDKRNNQVLENMQKIALGTLTTTPVGGLSLSALPAALKNALNTPQAQIVGYYLARRATIGSFPGADSLANLNVALAAAASDNTVPNWPAYVAPVQQDGGNNTPLSDAVQANWNTAFQAFGTAQGVYAKTGMPTTEPAAMTALKTSNPAAYKNAQVILQYFSAGGVLNATDRTNLDNAFTAANVVKIPANWPAAFAALGGAQNIIDKNSSAIRSMPSSMTSSTSGYAEALIILQYLNSSVTNPTDLANLNAAFLAAGARLSQGGGANQAQTKATELLAQIESSIALYNQVAAVPANGITSNKVLTLTKA